MGFRFISNDENEAIIFDDDGLHQASNYWTAERIENAIPIKITLPNPAPDLLKGDFESSEVSTADINKPPFNAGGKLFFSQGGKNYVGSAEFCEHESLILTAAHCVRDMTTGDWSENIVFKRGYNLLLSKQIVPVRAVALKSYWYRDKNYCWDYAFGISNKASEVDALSSEVSISSGNCTAFGYPSNYNSGEKMKYVDASIDLNPYAHNIVRMQGNTMGGGCSGGAWTKKDTSVAISLNSFSYAGDDTTLYGPLLTDDFNKLVEYAKTLL